MTSIDIGRYLLGKVLYSGGGPSPEIANTADQVSPGG